MCNDQSPYPSPTSAFPPVSLRLDAVPQRLSRILHFRQPTKMNSPRGEPPPPSTPLFPHPPLCVRRPFIVLLYFSPGAFWGARNADGTRCGAALGGARLCVGVGVRTRALCDEQQIILEIRQPSEDRLFCMTITTDTSDGRSGTRRACHRDTRRIVTVPTSPGCLSSWRNTGPLTARDARRKVQVIAECMMRTSLVRVFECGSKTPHDAAAISEPTDTAASEIHTPHRRDE